MTTLPITQGQTLVHTHEATCPHCGKPGHIQAASIQDHVMGLKGSWDLYACKNPGCGLSFTWPQPGEQQLRTYYSTYVTHESAVQEADQVVPATGLKALLKNSRAHKRRELLFLDQLPRGRVLEIGCGNGTNLLKLRSDGWHVMGQEIDPLAVAQARKLGIAVHADDLATMEGNQSFDVVILVHVIEHLLQPLDVLAKAKERLKPKGRLVLITPNPKSLGFRLFGRLWVPLGQPFHVRLYPLSTLRSLTEQLGLRMESMQTNSTHAAPNIRDSIQAMVRHRPQSLAGRLLRIKPLAKIVELGLLGLMLLGDALTRTLGDECVLICER